MNFSFNMTNNVVVQSRVETVLKDICTQWEGRTYLSHILYVKLLILWFVIGMISYKWNPHIKLNYKIDFLNKKINIIDRDFYLLDYIKDWIILILIVKIFDSFIIQFYYIDNMSFIEIIKLLIM